MDHFRLLLQTFALIHPNIWKSDNTHTLFVCFRMFQCFVPFQQIPVYFSTSCFSAVFKMLYLQGIAVVFSVGFSVFQTAVMFKHISHECVLQHDLMHTSCRMKSRTYMSSGVQCNNTFTFPESSFLLAITWTYKQHETKAVLCVSVCWCVDMHAYWAVKHDTVPVA